MNINKILNIHSDWLKDNGYYTKSNQCKKQSLLLQNKDMRQIEGYSQRRRNKGKNENKS